MAIASGVNEAFRELQQVAGVPASANGNGVDRSTLASAAVPSEPPAINTWPLSSRVAL